jgi:20S proteasome alpha/beta subunit
VISVARGERGRDMTVCIAAACRDGDKKKIVLCTDRKLSSSLGSAETSLKHRQLNDDRWMCLTAGDEADILALERLYIQQFSKPSNLLAHTIDASIKAPLHQRKAHLAEEYIQRRFAISYDEFMKEGKNRFPPELFYDAFQKVTNISLKAEFIIAGFIDGDAEIYYTDNEGIARAAHNFAVVGEGEYVAHSTLLRRAQNDFTPLHKTLYNCYEAKKFAEAVPSVGPMTYLGIIGQDKTVQQTSVEFDAQLAKWYGTYGPKDLPFEDMKYACEMYWIPTQ